MMISSKELRTYLQNLKPKILSLRNSENILAEQESMTNFIDLTLTQILKDLASWEARQFTECPELPFAVGNDVEQCLLIYCTPSLYRFVDKFEEVQKEDKDISLIDVGKIWLEVKKFLREGKFKRTKI